MPIDTGADAEAQAMNAAPGGDRRRFLAYAGGAVALSGGLSLLGGCGNDGTSNATPTPTPTASATVPEGQRDFDYLNVALNIAYLEASYYYFAAYGSLPALTTSGVGTQGVVTGGAKVTFTDPLVGAYARELATDTVAHLGLLQSLIGTSVGVGAAQPAINIDGSTAATGGFALMAQGAGIAAADGTFNPYASDENFLLGAFFLADVAVTMYKGISPLLSKPTYVDQAAGILGARAYHAGLIRSVLYRKGVTATPTLLTSVQAISDYRDSLDGSSDDDQGIGTAATANITPADGSAIVYSRSLGQVLNIFFLNRAAVKMGGFFPAGINGSIYTSAAN